MGLTFRRWPVIAVIAIGGLIIISIIWCISRCLCCGLSCCCECCYCLKCCGQCCGCCDPPRGKRHKYLDDPFIPPHHEENQAYRSQAPMTPSIAPTSSAPQYAVFDDGKKDADSLPAMPSWEGAKSQKVLIEDEPVEMEPLKKPENAQSASAIALGLPPRTTPSPAPAAGRSPYGSVRGPSGPNGYMTAGRTDTDPYSTNGQGYNQNQYDYNGYRQDSYGQNTQDTSNQGYGMAVGTSRSHTPQQDYNNGYGRGVMDQGYPQSRTPRPYNDEYGRSVTPGTYGAPPPSYRSTPIGSNPYENPSRLGSPGPQNGYGYGNSNPSRMRSPGPQVGFEYPARSQTQTPNSYNRQYPPTPQRQYSNTSNQPLVQQNIDHPYADTTSPVSPIQNTGGFDFSSGYSRPSTSHQTEEVSGAQMAPQTAPQTANGGKAYPGYRPYKPQGTSQQDNWNGA